jgi:ATP-dependent exoDNAse (exonuclease V) beta subunit
MMQAGRLDQGKIDCLYLHDGQWTLVDFKTDRLARHEQPTKHASRDDYVAQVRRYRAAVKALLGETPRALLCWLDAGGEIFVDPINALA